MSPCSRCTFTRISKRCRFTVDLCNANATPTILIFIIRTASLCSSKINNLPMNRSYKRPDESPSFSSSLLEKVFRSIDEGADEPVYSTAARKDSISLNGLEIHRSSIEKRKKKKKVGTNRRNFETEIAAAKKPERPNGTALRTDCNDPGFKISIRSYEDSELRAQTPSVIGVRNLKPIRTSTAASRPEQLQTHESCVSSRKVNEQSHRREGSSMPKPEAPSPSSSSFQNAKCRAAKMYGDLKNTKQPISPGGNKLTRFITSLFSKRNSTNKSSEKIRENEALHVPVTTCSSASSYYRSCLRNRPTASSSSKSTCPVNIVIDDRQQQRRCNPPLVTTIKSFSQKCDSSGENNGRSQVQSNVQELLEKYNNTNGVLNIHDKLDGHDDDDDDGGSCASSDLFELEHIGGNGNGTIHDELPIYESTHSFTARPRILI